MQIEQFEISLQMHGKFQKLGIANFEFLSVLRYCNGFSGILL